MAGNTRDNERNLPETILVWFLQILGAASAIIFGVYGVLSWQNSDTAKSQSDMANMLALIAVCAQGSEDTDVRTICRILRAESGI